MLFSFYNDQMLWWVSISFRHSLTNVMKFWYCGLICSMGILVWKFLLNIRFPICWFIKRVVFLKFTVCSWLMYVYNSNQDDKTNGNFWTKETFSAPLKERSSRVVGHRLTSGDWNDVNFYLPTSAVAKRRLENIYEFSSWILRNNTWVSFTFNFVLYF